MTRAVLAALVSLCVLGLVACPPAAQPCSTQDTVMAAHALECAARVRTECANIPDDDCPAIKECDAWGEARCGLGHAGAAGAP